MAARNTLSGLVELSSPTGRIVGVSLEGGVLFAHLGSPKRPERIPFGRPLKPGWEFLDGSDADLDLIRRAGYDLRDGRYT